MWNDFDHKSRNLNDRKEFHTALCIKTLGLKTLLATFEGQFFSSSNPRDQNVTTEGVFFSPEFYRDRTKIQDIHECVSFSPEFYRDCTKIQDIQECLSFSPDFYRDGTKIQDFSISHTGVCFFFTRILQWWDQNSGFSISHTGVWFFFIRILPWPYQNSGFSKKKHIFILKKNQLVIKISSLFLFQKDSRGLLLQQVILFFAHKKQPVGGSIHRIGRNRFLWRPGLYISIENLYYSHEQSLLRLLFPIFR